MFRKTRFLQYMLIFFLLLGCGGQVSQDASTTPTPTVEDDTIPTPSEPTYTDDGVTGGTFNSSDGNFSAVAPDGSIPAGLSVNPTVTEVTIDPDTMLASGETAVSDTYQLNLDSIDHFLTTNTVEVSLAFDSSSIPAEKLTSQYVYASIYSPDSGNLLSVFGTVSSSTLTLDTKGLPKNAIYSVVYNPDMRVVYPSAAASNIIRSQATSTTWSPGPSKWKVIYNPNHGTLRSVIAGIENKTAASLTTAEIDSTIQSRVADNAAIGATVYEAAGFRQPNLKIDNTSTEAYYLIHMRTNGRGSSFSSTRPDENTTFEGYTTGQLNLAPTRMDDAVGSSLGSVRASIAHEMFHAIQLGYDMGTSTDSRPVKEGTATPYAITIDVHGANADNAATELTARISNEAQKISDYLLYGMTSSGSKRPAYAHQDFFTFAGRKYNSNSFTYLVTLFEQILADQNTNYAANGSANIYIQPSREAVLQSMNSAFVSSFGAGNGLSEVYFNFIKDRAMEHSYPLRADEPAAGTLNEDLFVTDAKKSVTIADPETIPASPTEETFTNIAPYSSRVVTFTPAQAKDDITIGLTVSSTQAALGSTMRAALYRAGATTGTELTGTTNLTEYGSTTDDNLIILLSNTSSDTINITCRLGPPTDNTLEATVVINETNYAFSPIYVAGTFSSVTGSINRSGLPTAFACERTGAEVYDGDVLTIMTDPNTTTSAPATYIFNEEDKVFGDSNGSAALIYHTPSITHADNGTIVIFESTSGSITYTSYGSTLESYMSGTFEAIVAGSRETVANPDEDEIDDSRETLTGTITGSFGVTLGTSTEISSVVQ